MMATLSRNSSGRSMAGGRAEADRMPAVGDLAGAAERHVGVATRPDRDAALLPRLGHGAHGSHAIDAALPVDRLLRPARAHEGDVLVGDRPSPLERLRMERLELFLEPAHPRPEDDPAAREYVERGEHLRR